MRARPCSTGAATRICSCRTSRGQRRLDISSSRLLSSSFARTLPSTAPWWDESSLHIWGRTVAQVADVRESEETDRPRFFAAVIDLLSRASDGTPLVVLLDDLHWADAGTVDLLRHVLSVNRRLPVLIVGTFRDADVGAEDPFAGALAAFHREQGVTRLPLRGLDDHELLDFLELIAGHELEDDAVALRDALLAETDGNPFFVGELLRHLAATGAIIRMMAATGVLPTTCGRPGCQSASARWSGRGCGRWAKRPTGS